MPNGRYGSPAAPPPRTRTDERTSSAVSRARRFRRLYLGSIRSAPWRQRTGGLRSASEKALIRPRASCSDGWGVADSDDVQHPEQRLLGGQVRRSGSASHNLGARPVVRSGAASGFLRDPATGPACCGGDAATTPEGRFPPHQHRVGAPDLSCQPGGRLAPFAADSTDSRLVASSHGRIARTPSRGAARGPSLDHRRHLNPDYAEE
jgi:hypothetical protein